MDCTVVKLLLFLFVKIISSQSNVIEEKQYETLLLDTLFKDYDKRVRPVKNYHQPVVVNLSVTFNQILQVDEKHQVITTNILRNIKWKDDYLKWKPESFGNITQVYKSK